MSITIGENPDFDDLQNKLNSSLKNDVLKRLLGSQNSFNSEQLEIITKHFQHYNGCIKKIIESLQSKNETVDLLEKALIIQSKQLKELSIKVNAQSKQIEHLKNRKYKLFGLFKITF